jgi:hypothetical protein
MNHPRRTPAIVVASVIGALIIAAVLPLGGRAPQRCVYDGDSGSCTTLNYRSIATIGIANVVWGGDNTSTGLHTTPVLTLAADPLPSRAQLTGHSTCGEYALAAHYSGKQYPLYTCAGMLESYAKVRTITVRVGEKVTFTGLGSRGGTVNSSDPSTARADSGTLVATKPGTTAVTWPGAGVTCISQNGGRVVAASQCVLFELVVR